MHARRYFYKAMDSDPQPMGPALHLIARLYAVEDRAQGLTSEERLALRQRLSAPVMEKLHAVSARDPGRGSAEESGGTGGAVRAESVGGADALSRGWRSGDRQRRHRAGQP